ncbi:MerR family transcriptional regulator [Aureisphaera galaxeae]|uniref:MerR family transcriptional regulator n=1 Tax=Aureisphaera galaxeae TaxID=1538023 RepID=UPI002350B859|nr:MerR family transcriptional regulator [Aureisphaera galaxeae]MDC8006381.1 MerR family transcriptional regulator [Aureisphaera galaxeae]
MLIKTQFSIKDLENLSGVKAHTIRIWEKRYNLLEPARTDTNIRKYDLINLKKLLNVTLLYNEGYKISKIAGFKEEEIAKLINSLSKKNQEDFSLQAFKTAMFDFDHPLFTKTYNQLAKNKSFREIFYEIFLPLLNEIGLLWQTGTIDPSHERFISELIKQKIIINISKLQEESKEKKVPSFALYLPYEEIHEIGLLFANYEILSSGFATVYLGTNIPMDGLKHILKHYEEITFLSYFTVKPDRESVYEYVTRFQRILGTEDPMPLWIMGYKTIGVVDSKLPDNVKVVENLEELRLRLQKLKAS